MIPSKPEYPSAGTTVSDHRVLRIVQSTQDDRVLFTEYKYAGEHDSTPNRPGKARSLLIKNWYKWVRATNSREGKKPFRVVAFFHITKGVEVYAQDEDGAAAQVGLAGRVEIQRLLEEHGYSVYFDEVVVATPWGDEDNEE